MSMFTTSKLDIVMNPALTAGRPALALSFDEVAKPQSMGVATNPVGTFDEIILKASEGDMLRSMDNADGFYTTDDHFEVVVGIQYFSNGVLTIKDDDGLEVPRLEQFTQRILLHTLFMLIPKVDERIEMLNNLRTKREEKIADAQSIADDIASLDEFDSFWHTRFGDMSDVDKGALLLASSEGKEIQCYMPSRFGDDVWHATDFDKPLWNPQAFYRVKPLSYMLLDSMLMDVKFEITELDASIYELQSAIEAG